MDRRGCTWGGHHTAAWPAHARHPGAGRRVERTLIRARTGEGRERAKVRGVRFGQPKKLTACQRHEAVEPVAAGEVVAEVARTFGVDRSTDIARQRLCRLIESDLNRLTAEVLNQMSIDAVLWRKRHKI
jgi:hypothetical protein